MNSLVKIEVNDNYEQLVSARELHQKLGIAKDFTSWFKQQAERLNLQENRDYSLLTLSGEQTGSGGHNKVDFLVPIDIGKHLCMISGGETAWKIRDYFIQVERAWNSPEQVMARAIQFANRKILSLQGQVEELLPKAEMHDMFLTGKNAQSMGVAAKSLGIGRNRLFEILRGRKILMASNVPYQEYIERGYFRVVEKPITMGSNTINKPQTLVTSKGIDYIGRLLSGSGRH